MNKYVVTLYVQEYSLQAKCVMTIEAKTRGHAIIGAVETFDKEYKADILKIEVEKEGWMYQCVKGQCF